MRKRRCGIEEKKLNQIDRYIFICCLCCRGFTELFRYAFRLCGKYK